MNRHLTRPIVLWLAFAALAVAACDSSGEEPIAEPSPEATHGFQLLSPSDLEGVWEKEVLVLPRIKGPCTEEEANNRQTVEAVLTKMSGSYKSPPTVVQRVVLLDEVNAASYFEGIVACPRSESIDVGLYEAITLSDDDAGIQSRSIFVPIDDETVLELYWFAEDEKVIDEGEFFRIARVAIERLVGGESAGRQPS